MCGHSNKSYWVVLSCGTVYHIVQGDSNFKVCEWQEWMKTLLHMSRWVKPLGLLKCSSNGSRIGHFWDPKTLTFKMRPNGQPFLRRVLFAWVWKIISISKAKHLTLFWYRDPGELRNGLLPHTIECFHSRGQIRPTTKLSLNYYISHFKTYVTTSHHSDLKVSLHQLWTQLIQPTRPPNFSPGPGCSKDG